MSGKLKVHVAQDRCQGHARCKSLAPELFELDRFGNAHEIGDGTVPAGLEDKAWLAQANCPEIAIEVAQERARLPLCFSKVDPDSPVRAVPRGNCLMSDH